MARLRSLLLSAAIVLSGVAQATPTLTVCIDDAAGGFNFGTATCVQDNGAGDQLGTAGAIIMAGVQTGGLTIISAVGEPTFDPGFGMSLSIDGTVMGSWIVAVAQSGLEPGASAGTATHVAAELTGSVSGPGTASYLVYADDLNSDLGAWGPVGMVVTGGGFGASSGDTTLTDPFSVLAFMTLDASAGSSFYSADLTIRVSGSVPVPNSLALVGAALLVLAAARRRPEGLARVG